jgi:HK97 family phage prohead protease
MLAPISNDIARPRAAIHPDGSVEGYASLFGEIDQSRDMVMPGAFARTLAVRGARRIPMLFQHDPAEPIGIWLDLEEDWRGLRVRGRLIPEVMRARELLALLREGAADGLSIGFKTVRSRHDPKARIRRLIEVELWEISIVTFPLLPGARLRALPEARVRAVQEAKAPFAPSARARERDISREVREIFRGARRPSFR